MNNQLLCQIEHRLTELEVRMGELTKSLERLRTFGWGAIASLVASVIGVWLR